jgi:putative ABC transport system permease protein
MISEHFKLAINSIRGAKFRSTLTMLGIIVGVSSVVTIVSIGEGVKKQVSNQINQLGSSIIVVRPGKRSSVRAFDFSNLQQLGGFTTGSLSDADYKAVSQLESLKSVAPLALVPGLPVYEKSELAGGLIIATTPDFPEILNHQVEFGSFFSKEELNKNYAVVGRHVAEDLFKENVPIGKSLSIRGVNFVVTGIFKQTPGNPLSQSLDLNNSVVIPYGSGRSISGAPAQIYQILAEASNQKNIDKDVDQIKSILVEKHLSQEDFTVQKQEETISSTNEIFNQITTLIAGVAFISLLVGSVGIMNIMFATVSERTREIGVRKAVGATNRQILSQFLIESIVLSLVGGVIGIIISLMANVVIRVTTALQPALNLPVMSIAIAVSIASGILSGLLPAAKAARKEPVEALRYE